MTETELKPYRVAVRRRGASPLKVKMVVKARSPKDAGGLASHLAEQERGGMFEPEHVSAVRHTTAVDAR
jgi:hypothetical protein